MISNKKNEGSFTLFKKTERKEKPKGKKMGERASWYEILGKGSVILFVARAKHKLSYSGISVRLLFVWFFN